MKDKIITQNVIYKALEVFKRIAPVRTGWYRDNIEARVTEDGIEIFVDDTKVHYAKYVTGEYYTNPNYGWDEEAAEILTIILCQMLDAEVISVKHIRQGGE